MIVTERRFGVLDWPLTRDPVAENFGRGGSPSAIRSDDADKGADPACNGHCQA